VSTCLSLSPHSLHLLLLSLLFSCFHPSPTNRTARPHRTIVNGQPLTFTQHATWVVRCVRTVYFTGTARILPCIFFCFVINNNFVLFTHHTCRRVTRTKLRCRPLSARILLPEHVRCKDLQGRCTSICEKRASAHSILFTERTLHYFPMFDGGASSIKSFLVLQYQKKAFL
jgi:hypothetical protein